MVFLEAASAAALSTRPGGRSLLCRARWPARPGTAGRNGGAWTLGRFCFFPCLFGEMYRYIFLAAAALDYVVCNKLCHVEGLLIGSFHLLLEQRSTKCFLGRCTKRMNAQGSLVPLSTGACTEALHLPSSLQRQDNEGRHSGTSYYQSVLTAQKSRSASSSGVRGVVASQRFLWPALPPRGEARKNVDLQGKGGPARVCSQRC